MPLPRTTKRNPPRTTTQKTKPLNLRHRSENTPEKRAERRAAAGIARKPRTKKDFAKRLRTLIDQHASDIKSGRIKPSDMAEALRAAASELRSSHTTTIDETDLATLKNEGK